MRVSIRRCPYCNRPSTEAALSYRENPFCNACLPERMEKAKQEAGKFRWVREGRYFRFVPANESPVEDAA